LKTYLAFLNKPRVCKRSILLKHKMSFDYIKPSFNAVKPLLDAGTDVWVSCQHLNWTETSSVRMRPKMWTGVPFPSNFGDDGFEQSWNRNPWIQADPCSRDTIIKGKLVYVECSPERLEKVKGTYQEPELGYFLHFKPTAEPHLRAFLSFLTYKELMTEPPAGWVDTLSQEYAAVKQEAEMQKMKGLW